LKASEQLDGLEKLSKHNIATFDPAKVPVDKPAVRKALAAVGPGGASGALVSNCRLIVL
jgi:hypothetical protein